MKGKKITVFLCVIVFLAISVAVAVKNQVPSDQDYATGTSATSGTMTQWVTITIDGNPVTVDTYAQDIWYDIRQLTTERDMTVTASEFTGCRITVNGTPIESNGTMNLRLDRLDALEGIAIETTNISTGNITTNYIRTLHGGYYGATVLSNDPQDGYYYFNLYNYIYKVDTDGNVVFYKALDVVDNVPGGFDFKRTEVDGKVYYSYLNVTAPNDMPVLTGVSYARAYATIMDENYNEIDHVYYVTQGDEQTPLCNQQFTILGEGHYLISAYVGKRVDNIPDTVDHSQLGARVVANVIQEIQDGQVIWEWDSTDHPELYAMSVEGNDYYNETVQWADYAHLNAIAVDPQDDNLICSFRNLDAVLKLDRDTGEILWVLGGKADEFGLTAEQKFARQHDVRVTEDGALTLFNNGTAGEDETGESYGATTIQKFYLDEAAKTVTKQEEYALEKSYSRDYGSAQELSTGHYVIGWGERSTGNALFSEIDFKTNEVLFEFCYPEGSMTYRVYKDVA